MAFTYAAKMDGDYNEDTGSDGDNEVVVSDGESVYFLRKKAFAEYYRGDSNVGIGETRLPVQISPSYDLTKERFHSWRSRQPRIGMGKIAHVTTDRSGKVKKNCAAYNDAQAVNPDDFTYRRQVSFFENCVGITFDSLDPDDYLTFMDSMRAYIEVVFQPCPPDRWNEQVAEHGELDAYVDYEDYSDEADPSLHVKTLLTSKYAHKFHVNPRWKTEDNIDPYDVCIQTLRLEDSATTDTDEEKYLKHINPTNTHLSMHVETVAEGARGYKYMYDLRDLNLSNIDVAGDDAAGNPGFQYQNYIITKQHNYNNVGAGGDKDVVGREIWNYGTASYAFPFIGSVSTNRVVSAVNAVFNETPADYGSSCITIVFGGSSIHKHTRLRNAAYGGGVSSGYCEEMLPLIPRREELDNLFTREKLWFGMSGYLDRSAEFGTSRVQVKHNHELYSEFGSVSGSAGHGGTIYRAEIEEWDGAKVISGDYYGYAKVRVYVASTFTSIANKPCYLSLLNTEPNPGYFSVKAGTNVFQNVAYDLAANASVGDLAVKVSGQASDFNVITASMLIIPMDVNLVREEIDAVRIGDYYIAENGDRNKSLHQCSISGGSFPAGYKRGTILRFELSSGEEANGALEFEVAAGDIEFVVRGLTDDFVGLTKNYCRIYDNACNFGEEIRVMDKVYDSDNSCSYFYLERHLLNDYTTANSAKIWKPEGHSIVDDNAWTDIPAKAFTKNAAGKWRLEENKIRPNELMRIYFDLDDFNINNLFLSEGQSFNLMFQMNLSNIQEPPLFGAGVGSNYRNYIIAIESDGLVLEFDNQPCACEADCGADCGCEADCGADCACEADGCGEDGCGCDQEGCPGDCCDWDGCGCDNDESG